MNNIINLKRKIIKEILLVFIFTFFFLFFTSSVHATYPILLKHKLNGEINSVNDRQEKSQNNKGNEDKNQPDKKGFHISASLGYCELYYFINDVDYSYTYRKPGLTYKFSGDYWFGNHFGLGLEFQFHNFFGSSSDKGLFFISRNEFNYYISPYIKLGLISRQNWRIFFDLGLGGGGSEYSPSSTAYIERIFIKFALGLSIKIGKDYETGIIIDNKLMATAPDSTTETKGIGLFLFSAYPFIGYVF
jgi:hypothetical protein